MSTFRKFNKGVPKFSLKKRLSEPTDSEKEIREEIDKKETKKKRNGPRDLGGLVQET